VTRLAAAAALILLLTGVGQARGYAVQGKPWPGGRILYFDDAPDQAWAIGQAVNAWNESGANVQFVAAPPSQAQVVIEHFPRDDCFTPSASVAGEAPVGYVRHAVVYVSRLDDRSQKCNRYASAEVVAHELGHVLGLGHEVRACATMNPSATFRGPDLCAQAPVGEWYCSLLEADDVAGAVALYGGTARPRSSDLCPLYAGAAAPARLRVDGAGVPGSVEASFVRPPDPALPLFLRSFAGESGFAAAIGRGSCPASPARSVRAPWTAGVGKPQTQVFESLGTGSWCVAVWAIDTLGRAGARATAWIRLV
jgi:hypothetical protein